MRKIFFFFALFLLGCSKNGDGGPDDTGLDSSPVAHVPEISGFALSPSTASYMEGGGTSVVTAEISFRDSGRDVQTLWVWMPDGTLMQIGGSFATESGTITETFAVPTDQVGTVRRYTGGDNPSLSRMGGAEWQKTRNRVRARLGLS